MSFCVPFTLTYFLPYRVHVGWLPVCTQGSLKKLGTKLMPKTLFSHGKWADDTHQTSYFVTIAI